MRFKIKEILLLLWSLSPFVIFFQRFSPIIKFINIEFTVAPIFFIIPTIIVVLLIFLFKDRVYRKKLIQNKGFYMSVGLIVLTDILSFVFASDENRHLVIMITRLALYLVGIASYSVFLLLDKTTIIPFVRRLVVSLMVVLSVNIVYSSVQIVDCYISKNTCPIINNIESVFPNKLLSVGSQLLYTPNGDIVRPVGIFGDTNTNGIMISVAIVVLFIYLLHMLPSRNVRNILTTLVYLIASFIILLFTSSRSAYLGLGLTIIIILVLYSISIRFKFSIFIKDISLYVDMVRNNNLRSNLYSSRVVVPHITENAVNGEENAKASSVYKGVLPFILIIIFSVISIFLFSKSELGSLFISRINISDESALHHFDLISSGIKLGLLSPITGLGIGSFSDAYVRLIDNNATVATAHSTYAQGFAETGILGIIAIIILILLSINRMYYSLEVFRSIKLEGVDNSIGILNLFQIAIPLIAFSTIFYYGFYLPFVWFWFVPNVKPENI